MSVHQRSGDCPGCLAKLAQAHPYFHDWFILRIKPMFPDMHISWSYRNEEQQEEMFKKGSTHKHFPDSAHNKEVDGKPQSMALDLFVLNQDGTVSFPKLEPNVPNPYEQIDAMNKISNEPITWGGTWHSIVDVDHFQLETLN